MERTIGHNEINAIVDALKMHGYNRTIAGYPLPSDCMTNGKGKRDKVDDVYPIWFHLTSKQAKYLAKQVREYKIKVRLQVYTYPQKIIRIYLVNGGNVNIWQSKDL